VSPAEVDLPPGYGELLADLKATVRAARWQAQRVVNTELLRLYWRLGHAVLHRQQAEGCGSRVIDRLAADLRVAFPQMRRLSADASPFRRCAACPGATLPEAVRELVPTDEQFGTAIDVTFADTASGTESLEIERNPGQPPRDSTTVDFRVD
jgi:hypothetical protein